MPSITLEGGKNIKAKTGVKFRRRTKDNCFIMYMNDYQKQVLGDILKDLQIVLKRLHTYTRQENIIFNINEVVTQLIMSKSDEDIRVIDDLSSDDDDDYSNLETDS